MTKPQASAWGNSISVSSLGEAICGSLFQFSILNSQFSILNSQFSILNSQFSIHNDILNSVAVDDLLAGDVDHDILHRQAIHVIESESLVGAEA